MALLDEYKDAEREMKRTFKSAWLYTFLASVTMLAMPIFMFQVFDRVLKTRSVETLVAMLIFALIVLLAYGFFENAKQQVIAKAALRLETKMAGLLLAGEMARQSDAGAQSLRDLTMLRQVIASPALSALFELPMMPFFVAIITLIHPTLGFVVLMGVFVILAIGVWADRSTSHQNKEYMDAMMASTKTLESHLRSQEIVRAQGMYREAVSDWGGKHSVALSQYLQSNSTQIRFAAISKAARLILQVLMIASGAMLVLYDEASGGVIFASAMIGGRALSPVEMVVGSWRTLKQGWDTRARLMERLKDLDVPVDRTTLPTPKGDVTIKGITYVPRPGAAPIIRAASGLFSAGDSVAIIGPSGAGKSTLARIIVGYLVPNGGKVLLDGQDIHAWDPTARGLHMGYMPQTVTFFHDRTVGENIARLRENDPEEMVIAAAKASGLHEYLMKLPQGYDTVISPAAFMPSGGQAQLIALARAFYGSPKVLVLDEPNAALDQEGEALFHRALSLANKSGISVIVVTQRPSVLQHVNKVMLMKDGRVQDYGPKEKVMNGGNVSTKSVGQEAQVASASPKSKAPSVTSRSKELPIGVEARDQQKARKKASKKPTIKVAVKKAPTEASLEKSEAVKGSADVSKKNVQ
jgi:PrtD family type I secretion system ABC transporter